MIRAALIALSLLLGIAAQAQAKPVVGIGEQHPQMFDDQRWVDLDSPYVRYVVSWDAMRYKSERGEVDWFMSAARARHAKVLVTFGHSRRSARRARVLPSRDAFAHQFRLFRRRYPEVTTFQTWNEANHGTQPTWKRPDRAAKFYDAIRRNCRHCTVSAPSVLDDGRKMVRWIRKFRKAARYRVRIWSLHNHIDANRNTTTGTRLFLRNTRGKVWFTETGGIWNRWVDRRHIRRYNGKTAVRAIRNIFKLARLNPRRVKRIYVYNWFAPPERRPRWDTGLVDRRLRTRPTLRTLRAQIRRYGR